MASAEYGSLPFDEQIQFFRDKVSIDTNAWTDVYAAGHDIGFMVSGAKGEVLADLRRAIDRFVSEGKTLADFRKDFDAVVARTGWAYNGGRNWRTRVIYETNLRQSYAAGREAQMADPELRKARPYGLYRHGGSRDPRPEHLAHDGVVLPLDHPWWSVWSPMNGWGCSCKKYTLSESDVERFGLTVLDKAPEIDWEEKTVGVRGPSPRTVRVPKGIDPGFEYAPGASRLYGDHVQLALGRTATLPAGVASDAAADILALQRVPAALQADWERYLQDYDNDPRPRGRQINLGALSAPVLKELKARGIEPETALISLRDDKLAHILRDVKRERKTQAGTPIAVPYDVLVRLPDVVASPQAVLWDKSHQNLLYVFPAGERAGKLIVEVNYVSKVTRPDGVREKQKANSIVSGGIVDVSNLRQVEYEVLDGALEE